MPSPSVMSEVAEPAEMPVMPEMPMHDSKPKESDSVKIMPVFKSKGIEVVAMRAGYFKCCRKVEGDKFVIPEFSMLGSWMKCVDAEMEKKHQAAMKEKKLAGK